MDRKTGSLLIINTTYQDEEDLTAAEPSGGPQTEIPLDQKGPEVSRSLDPGWEEAYSGPDFDYQRPEGEAENYLARFLRWLSHWLEETIGLELSSDALAVLEFVIYAGLGVLALYLVVRYLIHAPFGQLFTREAPRMDQVDWVEQELEQADLDALLESAIDMGDYRLAIRYRYLQYLRHLSRSGRIDYHPEKTNWDYLAEMTDSGLRSVFSKASRIYEYAWYGEQVVDREGYEGIKHIFDTGHSSKNQGYEQGE